MTNTCPLPSYPDSVAALVAIVRAADKSGDKRLARAARRELATKYGVRLERSTDQEAASCK